MAAGTSRLSLDELRQDAVETLRKVRIPQRINPATIKSVKEAPTRASLIKEIDAVLRWNKMDAESTSRLKSIRVFASGL